MARYYCTCKKGERLPHDYQHTQYHETEVNEEGVCTYCGYYAFSRADVKHELFPRHKGKVTDMDVYKNIGSWKNNNHYHQYFHGCDKPTTGLARETLLKDQKRIRNAKKLRRANGNRG